MNEYQNSKYMYLSIIMGNLLSCAPEYPSEPFTGDMPSKPIPLQSEAPKSSLNNNSNSSKDSYYNSNPSLSSISPYSSSPTTTSSNKPTKSTTPQKQQQSTTTTPTPTTKKEKYIKPIVDKNPTHKMNFSDDEEEDDDEDDGDSMYSAEELRKQKLKEKQQSSVTKATTTTTTPTKEVVVEKNETTTPVDLSNVSLSKPASAPMKLMAKKPLPKTTTTVSSSLQTSSVSIKQQNIAPQKSSKFAIADETTSNATTTNIDANSSMGNWGDDDEINFGDDDDEDVGSDDESNNENNEMDDSESIQPPKITQPIKKPSIVWNDDDDGWE
ncbi:hypothetical protein DFA_01462 [Cavenderia fasciculata]|uniref:Uncharacterized protein n=1 Tax=Cavenderia fasciculata TaxID=261658 RepID=F4PSU8_CACFS|nr:uncharacterized protein DFA_01462 [Cavenderia fasciculata]EGG21576.1 hypothetical protein DFA_01462 [Cavenderia fasciculata]|eukprot:XP_004359426.1 hypothetical protein DFA_01462 [Cavenderia fasciculata]